MNSFLTERNKLIFPGLILLLPAALVSGPFFSDLIIVILGLFFIYNYFEYKNKYRENIYLFFFLLFSLLITLISIFSNYTIHSLSSSIFFFRFIFFAYAFAFLLLKYKFLNKILFISLSIFLIFLSLDAFFQYIFGYNFFGFKNQYPWTSQYGDGELHRVSGLFREELKLGSFLFKMFTISTALFFLQQKISRKYFQIFIITFISIFITILITAERTALMHLLMFIVIGFIFFDFNKKIKFIFFVVLSSLIVLFFSLDTNLKMRHLTILDTFNTIKNTIMNFDDSKNDKNYIFTSHHSKHYETAWNMFKNNKIIGVGPKNFRKLCDHKDYKIHKYGCSSHPHNIYLQLLSETGLLGFAMIFCFFLYHCYLLIKLFIFKNFIKNSVIKNYNSYVAMLITININLLPLSPSGNFFNNWNSIVFFMPLGILIYLNNNE